jgi:hypothetical protein
VSVDANAVLDRSCTTAKEEEVPPSFICPTGLTGGSRDSHVERVLSRKVRVKVGAPKS